MAERDRIHAEDIMPVLSRVSWGAVLAGAFVAMAVYVLLSVLGIALGLSLASELRGDTIATGGGIWALVTLLIALTAGGCVTTTCTAGENKLEAMIYGVLMWGVMFVMTLWATGSVMRMGTNMIVGSAGAVAEGAPNNINWEKAAEKAGLTEKQMEQFRNSIPSAQRVREVGAEAAWWSLAGVIISMAAAVGGALLGSGTTLRLRGMLVRRTDHGIHGGIPSASP